MNCKTIEIIMNDANKSNFSAEKRHNCMALFLLLFSRLSSPFCFVYFKLQTFPAIKVNKKIKQNNLKEQNE